MSEGNTDEEQQAPAATGITRRARKGPPRAGRSESERATLQQQERPEEERPLEEPEPPLPRMPLGIVAARIAVVSSLGFSAAIGIFFLIGGLWQIGMAALAVASVFILLMFAVERLAGSLRLPE